MENDTKEKCKHIECVAKSVYMGHCEYHKFNGLFANGETYEQYQIIEQDFIDFIKIVPIYEETNLNVYSPVLRDIIIRTCVQIELFLKEWAKYICANYEDSQLFRLYNQIDKKSGKPLGTKNWKFRHYFLLNEEFKIYRPLHVRDLNIVIDSFEFWTTESEVPEWWDAYNSIKHDGINNKMKVNLRIALKALAALFTLHCANPLSLGYLEKFAQLTTTNRFGRVKLNSTQISTPIDSKRYLFKDIRSSHGHGIEISNNEKLKEHFL